jgi:DNA-binding MarR family transcriptional regulator
VGHKDELIARIQRAEREFRRSVVSQAATDFFSIDLTMPQLRVVCFLAASGPVSAHELAEALHVGPTTLTGIVDRLEVRGLVRRQADDRDRRVRRICLTEEGQRLVQDLHQVQHQYEVRLLRRLDVDVLAALATAVEALARASEELAREDAETSSEDAETSSEDAETGA